MPHRNQPDPDEPVPDRRHERGASLVEYALLIALIAVVCIGAVTLLGRNSSTKMRSAGDGVAGGDGCPSGLHRIYGPNGEDWGCD